MYFLFFYLVLLPEFNHIQIEFTSPAAHFRSIAYTGAPPQMPPSLGNPRCPPFPPDCNSIAENDSPRVASMGFPLFFFLLVHLQDEFPVARVHFNTGDTRREKNTPNIATLTGLGRRPRRRNFVLFFANSSRTHTHTRYRSVPLEQRFPTDGEGRRY